MGNEQAVQMAFQSSQLFFVQMVHLLVLMHSWRGWKTHKAGFENGFEKGAEPVVTDVV